MMAEQRYFDFNQARNSFDWKSIDKRHPLANRSCQITDPRTALPDTLAFT